MVPLAEFLLDLCRTVDRPLQLKQNKRQHSRKRRRISFDRKTRRRRISLENGLTGRTVVRAVSRSPTLDDGRRDAPGRVPPLRSMPFSRSRSR